LLKSALVRASASRVFAGSGQWRRGGIHRGRRWPAQSEPIELQDALQVREQHFDPFALVARDLVGLGFSDVAAEIARPFMD
jgi:hypothetical protein